VVVPGDDEIGGGLNRAFQDAVIRQVLKKHDSDRRPDDRRSASDESEGGGHVCFRLMKFGSEDTCGLGQNREEGKERRLFRWMRKKASSARLPERRNAET
jgi:hypothetical protein